MASILTSSFARRVVALAVVAFAVLGLAAGGVAGAAASGPRANVAAEDAEVFVSMTPQRVLDTRPGFGPIGVPTPGKLGDGATMHLSLSGGTNPLPTVATAAVINVTIDQDATQKSFMTIWPKGEPRPDASANNAEPGFIAANSMIARLGDDGSISIYNDDGAVHVVIDVVGYMLPVSEVDGLAGSKFLVGDGEPGSGVGNDGDMYFDTDNKLLSGPKDGGDWGAPVADLSAGAKGDQGDQGDQGTSFLSGAGEPDAGLGNDGDSYVDTTTGIVYHKDGDTWSPIAGSLRGPAGEAGEDGTDGAPGPGAQVGDTTPTGTCSAEGLLHVNTATGEIVVCVGGNWSAALEIKSSISGATSYDDSGASPVAVDLGTTFANIASFTAPRGGTYVLDAEVTANQAAFVLISALETVHCAWFDSTNAQLGPLSSQSTPASISILATPNSVHVSPKAQVALAEGAAAHLRCRFSGISLGIGGFDIGGWAWEATRTA